MSLDFLNNQKPDLDYPCEWEYRVIGRREADLRGAISEVIQERTHTVALSNRSSGGKYTCLNVQMVVRDEEERVGIYHALRTHPATKLVL